MHIRRLIYIFGVILLPLSTTILGPLLVNEAVGFRLFGLPLHTIIENYSVKAAVSNDRYQQTIEGPQSSPIVVDHHSIELFDSIPEAYIQAAENLDMFFMDRSVGENIHQGLDCLSYPSTDEAPYGCRRLEHIEPIYNVDPSVIAWSRPGGYDRSNWVFRFWDQPGCGEWYGKVGCFLDIMETDINRYDVVSFQFSYLAVDTGSSIADQPGGYFWDNATRLDVFDQESFEAQHPDKTFIYWTTSLARGIGTEESVIFNEQMREYANENEKILFDVADILSHDPDGNPCYDNRDGIPYTGSNGFENYPDDGLDIPAICQHYTTEIGGGHLGSISAGKIRVAKAFWVLMAQIAGWEPGEPPSPTPIPTPTQPPTPVPTPSPTPIFEDVPYDHWAHDYISALYNAGYIIGCSETPRLYCPEDILNRAESAIYVLRGEYGAIPGPPHPAPDSPTFSDVDQDFWGYGWIESLWTDGFTAGCGINPPMYCPEGQHTRAEGSVFFLRAKNGVGYQPPPASGLFADVDSNAWYADWVEAAYSEGILPACGGNPLQFCPEDLLDRSWAAYMMVQAKGGLPLP